MSAARSSDTRVARVVNFFEQLSPADLPRLGEIYAAEARFKDPFNEVQGVPAITAVFTHMYCALEAPRFVVHDSIASGEQCFLTWDFLFRFKPVLRRIAHGKAMFFGTVIGCLSDH